MAGWLAGSADDSVEVTNGRVSIAEGLPATEAFL
jgi:hypothetical protein